MDKAKKKKIVLFVVFLAICSAFGYYQYTKLAAAEEAAHTLRLLGNVDIREGTVAFRQSDRIMELCVQEGDAVKKGQVLAKLDTRERTIEIQKLKAQLRAQESAVQKLRNGNRSEAVSQAAARYYAAQAEAADAEQIYRKRQALYDETEGGGLSEEALQSARFMADAKAAKASEAGASYRELQNGSRMEDIEKAEADLAALREELSHAEYLLSECVLKAPADGVIRNRLLEAGDMASPQQPVFKMSFGEKKWVRVYVKEADLGKIYEGQTASVLIDSQKEHPIGGTVGYISDTAEFTPKMVQTDELRSSLLYEVRVMVEDTDNVLRMGMPAAVRIDI